MNNTTQKKPKMSSTPIDYNESVNPEDLILREDLQKLKLIDQYADKVIKTEKDITRQIELLKLWTQRDLNYSISTSFAFRIICKAQGTKLGISEPVTSEFEIDITEDSMVWGEILMYQSWNLISALPKVGKSALIVGICGAVLNNKSEFLGLPIKNKFDNLIIVGNDQSNKQWAKLFLREGLCHKTEENKIKIDKRIALWSQGSGIQLNDEGIDKIISECKKRPNSLLLVDTLRSVTAQMGLDENKTEISAPIRKLQDATEDYGVTGVMLHHTTKSVFGGNAVMASSGSAAIPAAFDQTILMNWLKQNAEQSTQSDKRIAVSCMGRGASSSIVVELTDNKWISHGDGDSAIQAERMAEVEENLQGRQGDVYDLIINNAESDKYTSTLDISNQLNITSNKALRTLKALERKGLIKQEGVKNQNNKGRPIALFRPTRGTELSRGFNDFNDFNEIKTTKIHKTPDLSTPTYETCSPETTAPAVNIKVQRLKDDGEWQNGWVIADSSNPSDITIARMGSPHLTAQHYRWQINLKPTT